MKTATFLLFVQTFAPSGVTTWVEAQPNMLACVQRQADFPATENRVVACVPYGLSLHAYRITPPAPVRAIRPTHQ